MFEKKQNFVFLMIIIIKKIQNNWQFLMVILLSVLFFLGTSSFNYYTQKYIDDKGKTQEFIRWASPDETANYIFTKLYAQEGKISFSESYNLYTKDIMHPRSVRSDSGVLRPMSFLGIILIYGKIASVFGYQIIPYLTPFFGALGIVFFYLLIKELFNKSNAWLSASMLAVFPPYIFYTARSMFHNVLFMVLVIIGLYFFVISIKSRKKYLISLKELSFLKRLKNIFRNLYAKRNLLEIVFSALAGAFFGLAVITRASELLWLAPVLFFLWLFNFRKIGFVRLFIFVLFFLIALFPAMRYNKILYGSYYNSGYAEMNQSLVGIAAAGTDLAHSTIKGAFSAYSETLNKIKDIVFHFGFHPRLSLRMVIAYFIKMFAWLFWAGILGFITYLFNYKKQTKKQWLFIILLIMISAILVLYYGSWVFNDNPDKTRHTIGNSYTRYWLPIYLGAMPFAAMFIMRLTRAVLSLINKLFGERGKSKTGNLSLFAKKINQKFYYTALRFIFLFLFFYISISYVLFGSEEGLIFLAQRQMNSRYEWQEVMSLTENNSTIITFYHDKLFFPERKVIVGLFNDQNMNREYANLVDLLPVYYYNFTLPEKDFEYLNSRRLADVGLSLTKTKQITGDFTLYRINKRVEAKDIEKQPRQE
ncbi:MAG: hypothetical protein US83_C0002G0057 [Candidatus Falkowbacteria bacterium GW2011_GWC2_38_22]|uniref:Glycosyltransferase RgtA/B/C/D-like domain-containing protein n=1 Tax=Candidatus Falkowbacteria bacterium GW2011_GWE1_38_31 TaxID=1618638 RepID=A0A0G0K5K9_9BACT|nr:MAG: hypothetical protein US73_C0007G0057 [Candidatus Falkowbacteria bacterium GW2011_GWF2_38_1205]KKQ61968.1 MAG: hypothetical protein US83_C0002G0057 [Candidatus Falkowbacteria bacterium GW2011_GWC2_38_22]KKQ63870.1 MAG: hypothetical protein US84_C0003G0060 [Candidatus Falkowbacteria bacterium GW2011_GWF1_38_22]KKQ66127.1 MAG: hypothetical protein US87_C0003G0060 [Candidatus Falkowbacteria bacterium GW2011_GWE2_38_254]KKQ70730.1 MAG: hypothetical protein US91_C0003G0060 [Candidatus Falkowb